MDKKTKKELKKAVKRSRKRLQKIDDPTAWIAIYKDGKSEIYQSGDFERLRAENLAFRGELERLSAENVRLKAKLEEYKADA